MPILYDPQPSLRRDKYRALGIPIVTLGDDFEANLLRQDVVTRDIKHSTHFVEGASSGVEGLTPFDLEKAIEEKEKIVVDEAARRMRRRAEGNEDSLLNQYDPKPKAGEVELVEDEAGNKEASKPDQSAIVFF